MKKFIFLLFFFPVLLFAQSPVLNIRVTNQTTAFGQSLSPASIVTDITAGKSYIVLIGQASTRTISDCTLNTDIKEMTNVYPESGIMVSNGTGYGASITNNSTDWNTAFSQTRQWSGVNTGLVAATGRTSLGLGSAALSASTDFEVPLTFSTGLDRTNNIVTSTITQYTDGMADDRVTAGITGKENSLGNPSVNGYVLSSLTNGTRSWIESGSGAYEPALGNPGTTGYVLSSTDAGVRSWIAPGGGGGSMTYPSAGIALSNGSAWLSSIADNSTNWNTAYSQTRQWDGGATGLVAADGRQSLGLVIGTNVLAYRTFGTAANNNTGDFATAAQANATHTGDATGAAALTLATVNSNIGTYNNITINAKGLATAGSNVSYLTALTGAVLVSQSTPQTVGTTGARLAMLWATDLAVTNTITGSISGNALTATRLQTPRAINGVNFDGTAAITITAVSNITPGTTGNLMRSNGTVWTSSAPPTWNQNTTGSAASLSPGATINGTLFTGLSAITIPSNIASGAANNVMLSNGTVWTSSAFPDLWLKNNASDATTGTLTATNFILSSDKRLKNNIKPIDLRSVNIKYKQFELKSEPGQIRYGVIAQDLQKENPELVRTDKDGILSVAYIDLLIKEISALKNRITELERYNSMTYDMPHQINWPTDQPKKHKHKLKNEK
jgi:hypothetical protein